MHDAIKYSCDLCDNQSTLDGDLKQHIFIHVCLEYDRDLCDDKLILSFDLKQHIFIHCVMA